MGSDGIYGGKAISKRCVLIQIFLKGSNWAGWTDRQRQVVPKRWGTKVKSSSTCIGLDPRDWQTVIIVWSQWTGRNRCGKHGVKINRLFFPQGFEGQQIDLKQYSTPYWQPMVTITNGNYKVYLCVRASFGTDSGGPCLRVVLILKFSKTDVSL